MKLVATRSAALAVAALATSCVTPPRGDGRELLSIGMWIEAKGKEVDGVLQITEIEEMARGSSSKTSKVEVVGKIESAAAEQLELLGSSFRLTADTTFEGLDQTEVPPFVPESGDWIKVKARAKDRELEARTIRRAEPRKLFEVEGELTQMSLDGNRIQVGSIPLSVATNANIDTLRGVGVNDPLALFLSDEQKGVLFSLRLTDTLRMGGEMTGTAERKSNFDLDSNRVGDRDNTRVEGKIDLLWRFLDNGSFALLEGKVGRTERLRDGGDDTVETAAQISRGYAYLKVHDAVRLQIGRQDFVEEREWLYDEIHDGVRLTAVLGDFELEGAVGLGRKFLAEQNQTEDTVTATGLARYRFERNQHVTGYVIQRKDDTVRNFEPLLFGLRSYSKPSKGLGHWLELSHASGYEGFTEIDGYAFDAGVIYRADLPLRPSLTLGWALGSGQEAGSSKMGFRQTGLQDNNGKFGGVTSFRYYGEVMDPELANLSVTTLGLGARPLPNTSVDLVFHSYRQDEPSTMLVNTDLRTRPNGMSRDLGWGADLIVGYRLRWLSLEFIAGRFDPGDAFDRNDAANKFQLQGRLKF